MSILPGLQFGSGVILASPQTASGNPAPNPTPLVVGVIQNVKLTLGAEIKSLFGQNQWPVDSAIGKRTIKGSFEFAQLTNILLQQLFTGDSSTAGVTYTSNNGNGEAHTIPTPSGPYTVVITPPGSGTYLADGGVVYAATGQPLSNIGSGSLTAAGQYKEAAGTYTFDAADAGAAVLINYTYTSTTGGTTVTAANHPMGYGPVLGLQLIFPYESVGSTPSGYGFYLPNARLGKIDLSTKLDDYTMISTEFEAFAGANNLPFQAFNAW